MYEKFRCQHCGYEQYAQSDYCDSCGVYTGAYSRAQAETEEISLPSSQQEYDLLIELDAQIGPRKGALKIILRFFKYIALELIIAMAGAVLAILFIGAVMALFQDGGTGAGFLLLAAFGGIICAGLVLISLFYFIARKVARGGWLLAICLAVANLFIVVPIILYRSYGEYVWTAGSDFGAGYTIGIIVLLLAPLLGFFGSISASRKPEKALSLERPYLSIMPLFIACFVLSLATLFVLNYAFLPGGGVFVSQEYGFKVDVPRGYEESVDEFTQEPSMASIKMLKRVGQDEYSRIYINVYTYLPYTTTKISSFQDADQCYQAILDVNDEMVRLRSEHGYHYNYIHFGRISDPSYDYVHDHLAMSVSPAPITEYPEDIPAEEVYIWSDQFLYRIQLSRYSFDRHEPDLKGFHEVVSSFRFIEQTDDGQAGIEHEEREQEESEHTDAEVHIKELEIPKFEWDKIADLEVFISDIAALDETHTWVTDIGGGIYFFNGSDLILQASLKDGDELERLKAISVSDSTHAWTVSQRCKIYNFDGSSWSEQYQTQGGYLNSVYALDENHVWSAGGRGMYFYNGDNWHREQVTSSADEFFSEIYALDPNNVWAYGMDGIYYFDGSSWGLQYPLDAGGGPIIATDPNHAWILGFPHGPGGNLCTIHFFNGQQWVLQYQGEGKLVSDEKIISLVTTSSGQVLGIGEKGGIYACDGTSWNKIYYAELERYERIKGASADLTGNIWIYSEKAVYRGQGF